MRNPEPPQYTNEHPLNPETLKSLEEGLRKGLRLHAFRSGGGLRVVSLQMPKKPKDAHLLTEGYGEHYAVEVALDHTAESYLQGLNYEQLYSGENARHPHYWTGSSKPNSPLDMWLLSGQKFDAYMKEDEVIFELHGYERNETPEDIHERVLHGRETIQWEHRGFTYESYPSHFPGNGEPCYATKVIKDPKDGRDSYMWEIVKTGRAATLEEAIRKALEAPSVEKLKTP
jgi:hypothetical protein